MFISQLRDLGHIAGGMTCEWLRLWVNDSGFTELLQFITKLPGGLRPALVGIPQTMLCIYTSHLKALTVQMQIAEIFIF